MSSSHVIYDTPFTLPRELSASEPPEERESSSRSDVKLLVLNRADGQVRHSKFGALREYLRPGDLLVFNSSRTLPASLTGIDLRTGNRIEVRLAERLPDGSWLALLLSKEGKIFECEPHQEMEIGFSDELTCVVRSNDPRGLPLWKVWFSLSGARLMNAIYKIGLPVRYEHVPQPWSLDRYQNVYANQPGSAEMPSAGRAFTWGHLFDLKKAGIDSVSVVLHTGLSSYMDDELDSKLPISEEEYIVELEVAEKINNVRLNGGRIIAIGTTVVRTLESSARKGKVVPGHSYTRLRITPRYSLQTVDGLLTGLHEPQASHFDLLQAFLARDKILRAYEEAIARGYLWHEFGDLNLIL
jgi:S-adenosylmethionine:tRNA ribosyltransferase-isomerase